MYIRMVWGHLKPDSWDEYAAYYRDQVFPYNEKIDGLLHRALLKGIDGPDEAVSLSLWRTADDLHWYERSNLRKQLAADIQHNYAASWSYITGEYWVRTFQVVNVTKYDYPPGCHSEA